MITIVVSRWVSPFIFVFGLYIVAYGHLSPGGGFPGGIILACSFILALLARGKESALKRLPYIVARKLDVSGALFFLFVAFLGLVFGGGFFSNFLHQLCPGAPLRVLSGGTIMINNFIICIKICASIFLIILFLSVLRVTGKDSIKTMEKE